MEMGHEVLTWGGIVLAGGSIVAVIRIWIDVGKAFQKAEDMAHSAQMVAARLELMAATLADFKVEVAQTYATAKSLSDTETALARSVEIAIQGVYSRLDNMTNRLDSLITIAKEPR